jgi:hypothetical protein
MPASPAANTGLANLEWTAPQGFLLAGSPTGRVHVANARHYPRRLAIGQCGTYMRSWWSIVDHCTTRTACQRCLRFLVPYQPNLPTSSPTLHDSPIPQSLPDARAAA